MVAADLPGSANLANMEIITIKLRSLRAGLRSCREISVVHSVGKIEVFRRRKRGRDAKGRVVIARHYSNECGILKNWGEEQTGH